MTDSSPEDVSAIDNRVQEVLSDMFHKYYEGTYLTKFVLLAEVIDPDGGQSMWQANAPNMGAWDVLGFVEFAKHNVHNALNTGEDDD